MEQGLKIKIGADIVEVTQSLTDLKNDLKSLQDQLRNATGAEFVRLNKEIERTQDIMRTLGNVGKVGFDQFGQKIESTVNAVTKLGQSANRVNFTPISQTLRDAGNFAISANTGFLAISNNVPYVIDEFVRLKNETGSVKSAFSLLGSAFIGPTGIVALIGTAATVIPILVGKFLQSEEKAKKAADANKSFANSLKNINDGIASEATKVSGLIGVLENENETRDRKLRAIKELKQIQPDYFSQLELEGTTVKGLTTAYQNYFSALTNIAGAQAIGEKLKPLFSQLLDIEEKLSNRGQFKPDGETEKAAARIAERLKREGVDVNDLKGKWDSLTVAQKKAVNSYTDLLNVRKFDISGETQQLEAQKSTIQSQIRYWQSLQTEMSQYTKVSDDTTDKTDKLGQKLRETLESLKQYNSEFSKAVQNGDDAINKQFESTSDQARIFKEVFGSNLLKTGDEKSFKVDTKIDIADLIKAQREIDAHKKSVEQLKGNYQELASTLASSVSGALNQFIDDVSKGKNVFESFGSAVINMLKRIIINTISAIIEQEILLAVMNATGIGGAVSSASGTVMSLFKSGIFHASGGIATSAQFGVIGEAGPEAIIPLSQLGYLMQQVSPGMGNFGGGGVNVNVQGSLVAKGTDMVAVFSRSQKSMNRVG